MTVYNTPPWPCQLIKFCIRAEFLDTKLPVFTLPRASRANTGKLINAKATIMVILVILIHGLLSLALHAQNKFVSHDLNPLQLLRPRNRIFQGTFSWIFRVLSVLVTELRTYSFHKCILIHYRDLNKDKNVLSVCF